MSISSLVKEKSVTEPYSHNQVWIREFTNEKGQTVLLQLYSPSGGFTYPHRQLLGRLFGESYPKGYWVSRDSFESALKRKKLHSAGKLKSNAWTLSAVVNPSTLRDSRIQHQFTREQQDEIIAGLEADLIENLDKEKRRIINAITAEPGTENTNFLFSKVNLTDKTLPEYESQMAALGFFATNNPSLHFHKKQGEEPKESDSRGQQIPLAWSTESNICSTAIPIHVPINQQSENDAGFYGAVPMV